MPKPRRPQRATDVTDDFLSGRLDDARLDRGQKFGNRSKHNQRMKTQRTAERRAADEAGDVSALPLGRVVQVFSRYSEVRFSDGAPTRLCELRRTLARATGQYVVVGDRVRVRPAERRQADGPDEGVIERIEPRDTVLTRADSFKAIDGHPIVANAEQMLIVAAVVMPRVKWGLIDRMLVAALSGGLAPVVCLNKVDLAQQDDPEALAEARDRLSHYAAALGVATIETSVTESIGIDAVRTQLKDRVTVVAGHSGVGKSSLIRAVEPALDLRVGEVSAVNEKGKHTTTSARIYPLSFGGEVIDTPGVKLFGLWEVSVERLAEFFPDVERGDAPEWRVESFQRIAESVGE
jgi:ribosome biogenesis GTPase / thiamine phosphate phosphatase